MRKRFTVILLGTMAFLLSAEVVDRVAAVVGNEVITQRELTAAYRRDALGLMRENPLTGEPAQNLTPEQYLDYLIEQKIIEQEIKRQGIAIDDLEIDRAVQRKRESLGMTEEEFSRALALQGMSMAEYRAMVREQMITYRLIGHEVRGEIEIKEEEIQAYYRQHPEQFMGRDQYRLRIIVIRFSEHFSEERRLETIQHMEELRQKAMSGEEFAELARKHSEAPNAINGGDMGYVEMEGMDLMFKNQVKNLEPGQVSEVFHSEMAVFLLYLEEIKKGELRPLPEVREQIFDLLYQRESMERYQLWIERLKARTYIEKRLNPTTDASAP